VSLHPGKVLEGASEGAAFKAGSTSFEALLETSTEVHHDSN
jgi:hypothetical protein